MVNEPVSLATMHPPGTSSDWAARHVAGSWCFSQSIVGRE
jgi:hypothetical protein